MSENTASIEKPLSKQEIEEKLNKTEIQANIYQALAINKLLSKTNFRLDLFENSKKKINQSGKSKKKKPRVTGAPPNYFVGIGGSISEAGSNTPKSFSSFHNDDFSQTETENKLGRRQSRREKKPATKLDLGYEEPKPIKGVKLSTSAKEYFKRCEEILLSLKDEFAKVPEFSSKAVKFDQEIKRLRDGHYKNTMLLGNSIRKFLNNLFTNMTQSQFVSSKIGGFISKFEEGFEPLDNKTLFEENKYDSMGGRKKSGNFGGKKKLSKQGSRTSIDYNKPMSEEEKKVLSKNIKNLSPPQLKGVIKIVKDMCPEKDGMLEFDI